MRQAIVLTEAKWQLFTVAAAAFKKAAAPCVLVVRGRCKEKKAPAAKAAVKSAKPKVAAAVAVSFLFGLNALAGDITSYLPATTFAGATTNTTGGAKIGWNLNDILIMQVAINSTNNAHATTKSNVVVRFNSSLNGTDWQLASHELSIATATYQTNTANTLTALTNTTGAKWLAIGDIENSNTNRVYLYRLFVEKVEQ